MANLEVVRGAPVCITWGYLGKIPNTAIRDAVSITSAVGDATEIMYATAMTLTLTL